MSKEIINADEYIESLKETYNNCNNAYVVCSSLDNMNGFSIVIENADGKYTLKEGSLIRTKDRLSKSASIKDNDIKILNEINKTEVSVRSGITNKLNKVEADYTPINSLSQAVKLTCGVSTVGTYVHKLSGEYITLNISGKDIYASYDDIVIKIDKKSKVTIEQPTDTDEIDLKLDNLDRLVEAYGLDLDFSKWEGSFDLTFQNTFPLSNKIKRVHKDIFNSIVEYLDRDGVSIDTSWDANNNTASTVIPDKHYERTTESIANAISDSILKVEIIRQNNDEEETDNKEVKTVEKISYEKGDFEYDVKLPDDLSLGDLKAILKIKHFLLFTAPPGTGKTTAAIALAKCILNGKDSDRLTVLSFNQATEYSDTVSGLRQDKNGIWKNVNGTIKRICTDAANNKDEKYIIVLDEINRGNTLAALGEYLTAMSQIGKKIVCNTGETIVMPENVYIIATMNTTDSSVTKLDAALRDRFAIVEMKAKKFDVNDIKSDADEELKKAIKIAIDYIDAVNSVLINDMIKGSENQLGMRQLYTDYNTIDELKLVVKTCIEPQIKAMSVNLTDEYTKQLNNLKRALDRALEKLKRGLDVKLSDEIKEMSNGE